MENGHETKKGRGKSRETTVIILYAPRCIDVLFLRLLAFLFCQHFVFF